MDPDLVARELAEAGQAGTVSPAFLHTVLEVLGRLAPFDSAILVKPPSKPIAQINKREFIHLHRLLTDSPRIYGPGLLKGLNARERLGAFIDRDIYSASERRNLPFYRDIIGPQQISAMLSGSICYRGRQQAIFYLCRHGGSVFRTRELDRVKRALPAVGVVFTAHAPALDGDGGAQPFETRAAFARLTAGERQIADHASRGLRNHEIGRALDLSPNTVRNTLQRVFQRLKIAGRTELAVALQTSRQDGLSIPSAAADELTRRERQITSYVSRGLRNHEIAFILGTSPNTVHNQLQRIFEKVGIATRTELAVAFLGAPQPMARD
jgi:DNA-binding NarL/FixJ family response regulator